MDSIGELYRRLSAACLAAVGNDYELVFVNDGSTDSTWHTLSALAARDGRVVAVNLSRNYGHQLALTAGLSLCRGRRVLIIDADLQDPPELLAPMMKLMDNGADVVYGQRISRAGETMFKRLSAALFYRLLAHLTDIPIPVDTGDFRLVSRRVVDVLNRMPEPYRFLRGMVSWMGFAQVPIHYERAARFAGYTKYPLRKMVRFAADAVTGFSIRPLRLSIYFSLAMALASFSLLGYALASYLYFAAVPGWTSVISVVLLLGSAQMLVIGILGEYVGRLYMQGKQRPLYIISDIRGPAAFHASSIQIPFTHAPAESAADCRATLDAPTSGANPEAPLGGAGWAANPMRLGAVLGSRPYQYSPGYYEYINAGARRSAQLVLPVVLRHFDIRSVVDFGCGQGAWLAVWRALGIEDFLGVDGAYVKTLLIPTERFVAADLSRPVRLGRSFDLVQSLEVAEHLPPDAARTFVHNLVSHGPVVLFSAAVPGQGGENHVNEQPYEYWRQLFLEHDYLPLDLVRPAVAGDRRVEPWYRYNSFVYVERRLTTHLPARTLAFLVSEDVRLRDVSSFSFRIRRWILRRLPTDAVTAIAAARAGCIASLRRIRSRVSQ